MDILYRNVTGKFIYNGYITTEEDFRNIHYAFIGAVLDYHPTILFIGGGYAAVCTIIQAFFQSKCMMY